VGHENIWGTFGGSSMGEKRGRKGYWGLRRKEVCYIYTYKCSTRKLTTHFETVEEKKRENGNIMEGWTHSEYSVCMYGIISMKSPHILIYCNSKLK
jgi:hypothetical protein